MQQFEGKIEPGKSVECTEVSRVWTRVGSREEVKSPGWWAGQGSALFTGPWLPRGGKQKYPSYPKPLLYGGSFSLTALCPKKILPVQVMRTEHTLFAVIVGFAIETDNPSWERHVMLPSSDTARTALSSLAEGGSARALQTPPARLYVMSRCCLGAGPSSPASDLVLRPFTCPSCHSQSFPGSSAFAEASALFICRAAF